MLKRINAYVLLHRFDPLKRRGRDPDLSGEISEGLACSLRF
jgi:hypothetical protein